MATTSTLSGILPKYNKFVRNITLSQLIKCAFVDTRSCECMVYCMTCMHPKESNSSDLILDP